jgi:integrase
LEEVDLKKWTFTGGMKTDAGNDRIVPIHSRVRHLVERKYKQARSIGSKYLINCIDAVDAKDNLYMDYDKYRTRFARIRRDLKLDPNHRSHDPRMHFVTMAKKYKVDEYAIKYMVGHAITDITEKVYTKRDIEWLKEEIEKIK